ncbi:hypothetical protein D922_01237 [Enterococcus faecalis 06-MB-DW-09]|nr:hypothetical protein D922_01237 [Enterococcus faecalis 06-MB-DW-09]
MIDSEKFALACVSALNINAGSDKDIDNALDVYIRAIEKAKLYNAPFEENFERAALEQERLTAAKNKADKEQLRKLLKSN